MLELKVISMEDAVRMASNPQNMIYRLVRVEEDTTVYELDEADGFYLFEEKEEAAPEPEVKAPSGKIIDHGRICALYTANPPRSVQWIADDMKISAQTVINHLKKEGIYKK